MESQKNGADQTKETPHLNSSTYFLPLISSFLKIYLMMARRIVGFEGITGESSKEINAIALELRLKQAGQPPFFLINTAPFCSLLFCTVMVSLTCIDKGAETKLVKERNKSW
jgi:hypothetical protein